MGDLDVVVALQVHGDLPRAEVVVLAQVEDLPHHVHVGGPRADLGPFGEGFQALLAELVESALPDVEGLSGDAEVPAGHGDVAGDLLSVLEHRQAVPHMTVEFCLGHPVSVDPGGPECQASLSVS
jgi:hypothetical protein